MISIEANNEILNYQGKFEYVIGMFLKALEFIKDKYIPCILLVIGIAFSIALIGLNVNAVIQDKDRHYNSLLRLKITIS